VTIFVSTAYLDEAERCNRIGLLHQGRLLACDTVEGVKGLLKGVLLELRCEAPRRALAPLRAAQLGTVTLFGDRIHLLVTEADRGRTAVEAVLHSEGILGQELRVIEPTLEDVFTSAIPAVTHA
jgi:ABC-2 type transport system ATP-binding protein